MDWHSLAFDIGVLAGLLQALGYLFYLSNADIEPNPVSWFMFAYGTLLLTILEWDVGARFAEYFLPLVCGVLSIYVAFRCWKKAREIHPQHWWPRDWWPENTLDKSSFILDICITFGYIAAWFLASYALLDDHSRYIAVLVFLWLSNISTIPSFVPILRSTYHKPQTEHWLPWMVWTLSYSLLAVTTYLYQGTVFHVLMLYPLLSIVFHFAVALLALRGVRQQT